MTKSAPPPKALAAAVRAYAAAETVSGIGAFNYGRQLRVPHAGHLTGGADRPRTDADLDDVGAGENQLLGHVTGDDVACHDHDIGEVVAHLLDEAHKGFGVAVGHVNADVAHSARGSLHDGAELFVLGVADAERIKRVGFVFKTGEEVNVFLGAVVLVQGGHHAVTAECAGHFKRTGGIHVGGDHGNGVKAFRGPAKLDFTGDVHLAAAGESRALRTDQHILKVKFDLIV